MEQNGTDPGEIRQLQQPEGQVNPRLLEYGTESLTEQLTNRQLATLPLLLKPGTLTAQANEAGVGRTTLYRWLEDEPFRQALQMLRAATWQVAASEIQAMSYEAANVLRKALESNDMRLSLKAAKTIIDRSDNILHIQEIEKRIESIADASTIRKQSRPW